MNQMYIPKQIKTVNYEIILINYFLSVNSVVNESVRIHTWIVFPLATYKYLLWYT